MLWLCCMQAFLGVTTLGRGENCSSCSFSMVALYCSLQKLFLDLKQGDSLANLFFFFLLRLILLPFLTVKSFSYVIYYFPEVTYPNTQCILHALFLSYRNHDYGSRHDEENLLVIKGLVGCSYCEFKGGRNFSILN